MEVQYGLVKTHTFLPQNWLTPPITQCSLTVLNAENVGIHPNPSDFADSLADLETTILLLTLVGSATRQSE